MARCILQMYFLIYIYIYRIPKEPGPIYLGFTYWIIRIILTSVFVEHPNSGNSFFEEIIYQMYFIDKAATRKNKNYHKKGKLLFISLGNFVGIFSFGLIWRCRLNIFKQYKCFQSFLFLLNFFPRYQFSFIYKLSYLGFFHTASVIVWVEKQKIKKIKIYIYYHHHPIMLLAQISLTLSHHSSLSSISTGRSFKLHPVSVESCCK